jgi:DNA (cytosine-5)-methyltransferase 1
MKHLDLFSGIGGFALAASWVWGEDHEIVSFVEIDEFCQKVFRKHWPDVPIHDDIRTYKYDGKKKIDLITGGFPCQDISLAGKGEGIDGEKSGLWKEMFRVIREVRPRFVIIENSAGLLVRGGTKVLADIASIGMDAQWQTISAKEVGAPHQRNRLYIVAYADLLYGGKGVGNIFKRSSKILKDSSEKRHEIWLQTPDTTNRVDDGISPKLYRMAVESLGNAIVPQVVQPIMEAIKEIETEKTYLQKLAEAR